MALEKAIKVGDPVRWKWMGGYVEGEVVEIHYEPITKLIKGKSIKRNGSKDKPAYLVKSKSGNFALKLSTEIEPRADKRALYTGSL